MQMFGRKLQSCNRPLRAAIIGCGWVAGGYDSRSGEPGVRTHARAYALDGRTELVAACDVDPERLRDFTRAWNIEHGYTNVREMLDHASPDIVSICAPDELHYELLEICLDFPAVRGVWCEKPLAKKTDGCAALLKRYRESGVALLVNYMRSYCAEYLKLKKRLLAGEFGAVRKIVVCYTKGINHNGSHAMDLLLDWLGEPDSMRVTDAFVDHDPEDPTVDACLMFHGIPAYLLGLSEAHFSFFTITVFTDLAQISLEEFGRKLVVRNVDAAPVVSGHRVLGAPNEYATRLPFAMADALSNLLDMMRERTFEINGGRALKVLELTRTLAETGIKVAADGK